MTSCRMTGSIRAVLRRAGVLAIAAVVIACSTPGLAVAAGNAKSAAEVQVSKSVGGPFELVDANGRTVTDASFRGKWMLVFFGYMYCPDVCPTTLNTIAEALDQLGPSARDVQPIFISFDPQRDTPGDLAEYTAAFDRRILGLTGSPEQVAAVARAYKVYYKKVGEGDDYTMDHSAMIYLIGPRGRYVARFSHHSRPARMAAKLKKILDRP